MNAREILSIALAIAVVGFGLFAMEMSVNSSKRTEAQEAGDVVGAPEQVIRENPKTISNEAHARSSPHVVKCAVNGRTIYTDQACAGGGQVVELGDTAGINGDSLAAQRLANLTASRLPRTEATPYVTAIEVATQNTDCDTVSRQISQIDSQARQPQSARQQEWLKNEKARLQKYAC